MAERVEQVPNPWAPYMDGCLWSFPNAEFNIIPRYNPITDETGEIVGPRQYIYVSGLGDRYYVRFVGSECRCNPEQLKYDGLKPHINCNKKEIPQLDGP